MILDIQVPLNDAIAVAYKVFGAFLGVVILLVGLIGGFVKMLHSDMKKSIEVVHDDLKPLILDVTQIKVEIINIKEDHKDLKSVVAEQNKWLNHYDSRIQATERTLSALTK